jgi:hypothetical protein
MYGVIMENGTMAIYHCRISIISRGKGRSAVASAAYRAAETITNEYDGVTHDYTRKRGIVHTEILLPGHAPSEYTDRSVLWNAVEKIEKASNAQLAREIEVALPIELSREQNVTLVRDYVQQTFVDKGMCADVCVHDTDGKNPHTHIMLTMRPMEPDGSWGVKQRKEYILDTNGEKIYDPKKRQYKCGKIQTTDWNELTKAEEWRAAWKVFVNAELEYHGFDERIDHRSFERQGIEQIPTIHMGVAATRMERRGLATERGDINREIAEANNLLRRIWERIKQMTEWLKSTVTPPSKQTLANVVQGVLNGDGHSHTLDRKAVERVYSFLKEHNISTSRELRGLVSSSQNRLSDVRDSLKSIEGRMGVIDESIRQVKVYHEHRELHTRYRQLKPRKQAAFYETNRAGLMLFEYAQRYLAQHHVNPAVPLDALREERVKLSHERGGLYREYTTLNDRVWGMETIRRDAERIMRDVTAQERVASKQRDAEWER